MMWLVFFPVIALLYGLVVLAVLFFKALVVLAYMMVAVAAWVIRLCAKGVVRYTT